MNNIEKKLKMKFDPNTIDDLGSKLYTTLPPILAEQIANSYDAHATKVYIDITDNQTQKTITILDNGHGMSFNDVDEKYLTIGRKKRIKEKSIKKCCKNKNRLPVGRKGLGKLSFFGISDKAEIETTDGKGEIISFEMDIIKIRQIRRGKEYEPEYKISKTKKKNTYTKIKLCDIKRTTNFDIDALKKQISNYFIFDTSFGVYIKYNNEKKYTKINNDERYNLGENKPFINIKIKTKKDFIKFGNFNSNFLDNIKGEIIIFDKPVPNRIKGLTLFSRGKLVNLPEFFPFHTSSHITQYLTGWLSVDFIEDLKEDVISTNRQSLNWENEDLKDLKEFLNKLKSGIEKYWREKTKIEKEKNFKKKYGINYDKWVESNKNNKIISGVLTKLNNARLNSDGDDNNSASSSEIERMVEYIHTLAPEFADLTLWRGLHKNITKNEEITECYKKKDYYGASREAIQCYEEYICDGLYTKNDGKRDSNLMEAVFSTSGDQICLYNLSELQVSKSSESNIQISQKDLSKGLMSIKNVIVSHTSKTKLNKIKKYFTEQDCLYILSIVSYLYTRLDRRVSPKP